MTDTKITDDTPALKSFRRLATITICAVYFLILVGATVRASGAGMGIRFDIPGFPIRIDYAWPVRKDSELTKSDRWIFWIGYDF